MSSRKSGVPAMSEQLKNYHTFVDRTNPITKMAAGLLLFILAVLMHNPNQLFYLCLIMMIALIVLSGIKLRYLGFIIVLFLIFGAFSAMYMVLYGAGTTTVFRWGLVHITGESLIRGVHIMMRGLTLSFFGALIIFSTRLTDVFYSLMIQLRLKPKFAYSFMAAIRMVPIIANEYLTLRRTRKVRKPLIHRRHISGLKGFVTTVITLLSQSIRRAYRLGVAMEAKQFDDGPRTYYYETRFTLYDILFIVMLAGIVLTSFIMGTEFSLIDVTDAR